MDVTQPVDWIGKPFTGYVVNTDFSEDNGHQLAQLTQEIEERFGEAVFCTPYQSLHITLLDWIAPLVDYGGANKDELFARIRPSYDEILTEILASTDPITVRFNDIKTSPTTIYIMGHDNGAFQRIREQFVNKVELLPGTKLPPQIVHSSLARFTKSLDFSEITSFLRNKRVNITQKVTGFRLLHTTKEPTLAFEVLKRYQLRN